MTSFTEFYSGRRVLVTGHTGFKGAWLVSWLKLLGAEVSGFALAPEQISLFEAAGIAHRMDSMLGDVRDPKELGRALVARRPELVFHLAAQSLVRRSYRDPLETYSTNVLGTAHLLEACRHCESVRAVVVVTSDKCYENREWQWGYRENEPLGGHDPYSSSKAAAELVTAAYRSSFFAKDGRVGIASARAGNVIGGGDWCEDRLVPDIVRGAFGGKRIVIRNPSSTRPWQHVLEPLAGYLRLAERLHVEPAAFSEAFNFGPSDADVEVGVVAQKLVARLGCGALELRQRAEDAPHEARTLKLDSSKARTRLGWSPLLSFEDALSLTADWYREFHSAPGRAAELVDAQLAAYTARLDGKSA